MRRKANGEVQRAKRYGQLHFMLGATSTVSLGLTFLFRIPGESGKVAAIYSRLTGYRVWRSPAMTTSPSTRRAPGGWLQKERHREALAGYLFILPTFLGYTIFIVGPIFAAIGYSLTSYSISARRSSSAFGTIWTC